MFKLHIHHHICIGKGGENNALCLCRNLNFHKNSEQLKGGD